jgi:GH35 family endo-1,4-beta-xylanase
MTSFESLSVLRQAYCCPMDFGVAVRHDLLTDVSYNKIIPYVFDSITCENEMKPNFIRSPANTTNYNTPSSYNYSNSDTVIQIKLHAIAISGCRDSLTKSIN